MPQNYKNIVGRMSVDERIQVAKSKVKELTYRIEPVIRLRQANEIIQYSGTLADQVPKSYAAWAFNEFTHALFAQEIVRLLALWERPEENRVSIPTVVLLIDDDDVLLRLAEDLFEHHAGSRPANLNPSNDPEMQAVVDKILEDHQREFGNRQAMKALDVLMALIVEARKIIERAETEAAVNLRDHLSHNLSETRRESRGFAKRMKHGEEKELLNISVRLVENLYCWVNGTSYDISGEVTDFAKRQAEELWLNCKFDIPDRMKERRSKG